MPESRSQGIRQTLHLSIDPPPYPYRYSRQSSDSPSPSSSSNRISSSTYNSNANNSSPPTSGGSDWILFSVLCLFDFTSDDPDHLPFRKNEILDVVKRESSGWWAALRPDGAQVGWVPSAFVQPLSEDMTDKLRELPEKLRGFEYDAEKLYDASSSPPQDYHEFQSPPLNAPRDDDWVPVNDSVKAPSTQLVTPTNLLRDTPSAKLASNATVDNYFDGALPTESSTPKDDPRARASPSPAYSLPHPKHLMLNKPTPPTPLPGRAATFSHIRSPLSPPLQYGSAELSRSHSESAARFISKPTPPTPMRTLSAESMDDCSRHAMVSPASTSSRLRQMMCDDTQSLHRLSSPAETRVSSDLLCSSPEPYTPKKDEGLQNAKLTQAHLPWYLRPSYTVDVLRVDFEGNVKAGTLPALVERLTADPFKPAQDTAFRNAFLMTFRTFTTANVVFDMLVERYQMDHPSELTSEQFEDWKQLKLRPTQKRVLTVLTMWLEDHRMLEEEPHIGHRLNEFLSLIVAPAPLALTAKLIQESLERLTFGGASPSTSIASTARRRKSKAHRNDLLRLDPTDIAEQLCLLEHRLYSKITPTQCLNWTQTQTGKTVANLSEFCATHDRLSSWVKMSILNNDVLGKRADTVDFWIKVAEKCRNMNNFSSMSAVLTALSSTVVTRLHLTWAHTGRKSHLDAIAKYNEPTGGFAAYRQLSRDVTDAPCVPFITMYLTELVHVQDQLPDMQPQRTAAPEPQLILFTKRQRWFEIISAMLRHQGRVYQFAENESTRKFMDNQMREAIARDQAWFWSRSQAVQQTELAHADIRKGLEAAGF